MNNKVSDKNKADRASHIQALLTENQKCSVYVFPQLCKGCGLCIVKCPREVLRWSEHLGLYGTPVVESGEGECHSGGKLCNACGICEMYCPDCAIKIVKK